MSATVNVAGGSGAPGGGGGGASSGPPPRAQRIYPDGTVVYLDEPTASAKIKELDAKFDAMEKAKKLGAIEVKPKSVPAEARAQASTVARTVSPVFNKDLARGAKGADVARLQELLGVEQSGFFGPLTEKALKDFQVKHGVVKSEKTAGAGKLGPATRAKLKKVFEATTEVSPSATPNSLDVSSVSATANGASQSGTAPVIVRRISSGSRGNDVKALQTFLGVEATGYFGKLTRKAVQDFQEKYGIAKTGDQGYGDVGPLTRAILKGLSETIP